MAGRILLFAFAAAFCTPGVAMPELDEAKHAFERGQFPQAQKKLMFAAEVGDPEAQELLGFTYAFGPELYPGTRQDLPMAAVWLGRAASNGRPAAQHLYCAIARRAYPERKLGLLHCFGEHADFPASAATTAAPTADPARRVKRIRQAR